MNRGETERHRELKRLALAWARTRGLDLAAAEVRIPRSGCRADVAAAGGNDGPCALFECKQSREDLRRDAHDEAAARARWEELTRRARALDELLATHCPALRRGEALWPEFDTWDFSGLRHRGRRALAVARAAAERRVRDGTKFSRLRRYHAADELYLVVEPDCFAPADLPAGQWQRQEITLPASAAGHTYKLVILAQTNLGTLVPDCTELTAQKQSDTWFLVTDISMKPI